MKEIKLTREFVAIVDDDDFEWLSKFRWQVNISGNPRATRNVVEKMIYMHREIIRARHHEIVDHINGNGLDNRKENLRLVNSQQNSWNSKGKNRNGYKGLLYRPDNPKKPWRAAITKDAKTIHLGYFATREDAARAYNKAAIEVFGNYARLNEIR